MTMSPKPSIDLKRIGVLVLLGVLIFGIYYNILGNPPTNWDDPALFNNSHLTGGFTLANLKQVLILKHGATYQPLRDLSYMLDFTLWKDNPVVGLHLHSILLYYFMVITAWMFLLELFRAFSVEQERAFLWACMAAVIFAVHPMHVESVAWIYARKEPLLGIFTFLSLWAFVRARRGSNFFYVASGMLLILAVLSQPTALVIPAVMIVIDLSLQAEKPDRAFWKKRALIFLPMLAIVIPMMGRLVLMMSSAGGVKPYHGGSFWTNLLAVSQIFIEYIRLTGFTLRYVADYPIPLYTSLTQWQTWVFLGLNIALIISGIEAYLRGRHLYAIFVAWFYIFLLPVSHIFPISQILADRYALIPSLSWCVALAYLLVMLWEKRLSLPHVSPDFPRLLAIALLGITVVSYAAMTIRQNTLWRNSQLLWENTLARFPLSSPANVNLSVIYIGQGRYEAAQELCLNAIKALPYDYLAISNLALAQTMMGQYDNAIHNYQQALRLRPDLEKTRLGLGNAYWGKQDFQGIYHTYREILATFPTLPPYFKTISTLRLGYAAWKLGKPDESASYLSQVNALAQQFPTSLKELAEVYTSMGNTGLALTSYQALLNHVQDPNVRAEINKRITVLRQ